MKSIFTAVALLSFSGSTPVQATAPGWLIGCWESNDKTSKEVWVAEPDGALIGFSVSMSEGKLVFFEVLRIASTDAGELAYTAYPSGQSAATFAATLETDNSIVFVNADHDYPQQISYHRQGKNLFASISALGGKKARSFNKHICE